MSWNAARRRGRRSFVETRIVGVGATLGAVLAVWNALMGGTFADYDVSRLILEGCYYVAGSMVLAGLSAVLEWRHLERRFRVEGARARHTSTKIL